MKILKMLSPSTYLEIFRFQKNWENKPKQSENVPYFGFGTNCIIWQRVSFSEAADHPTAFTKINVPAQMFLCFIIGRMVPNCKTHHICAFLHFQETLSLDVLEMNFPKIVAVIILWNIMSQKRFSCWVMDQKAIDQLDWLIFPSIVSL